MWIRNLWSRYSAARVLTCIALFANSAQPQQSSPTSLESEAAAATQVEDVFIREQLRRIEEQQKNIDEQQKMLMESLAELRRRLDARSAAIALQSTLAPQPGPVPVAPPNPAAP